MNNKIDVLMKHIFNSNQFVVHIIGQSAVIKNLMISLIQNLFYFFYC